MHFLFTTRCTLSKRSKTHKRLKERFLTGRNRSKRANVRGSPLFQATFNTKTEKQTINSTYLASEGIGMFVFLFLCCAWLEKEDFLENLHVLSCFVQLKSVLLISCVFWIFFLNAGSQLCFRLRNFKYFFLYLILPSFSPSSYGDCWFRVRFSAALGNDGSTFVAV